MWVLFGLNRASGTYPAGAEGVNIGAADARVGDLDVDVGLLPDLGLIPLPHHVTLGGGGVCADPSLKLVVGGHCDSSDVEEAEESSSFDVCGAVMVSFLW